MEELIMRIKDFRSGAERLNDIMSVCEDKKFTEVEASEVIDALAAVRADVFLYVQDWASATIAPGRAQNPLAGLHF